MPVSEHPFDGSWGLSADRPVRIPPADSAGLKEFSALVDACHREGLGVMLDWATRAFSRRPAWAQQFRRHRALRTRQPAAGPAISTGATLIYNYGRNRGGQFPGVERVFWLERYGIDGLRVDAVASMLLSRLQPARRGMGAEPIWRSGKSRRHRVPASLQPRGFSPAFPKHDGGGGVNRLAAGIAPVEFGGLGFGYKWNMGWMHDTLNYIKQGSDPPQISSRRHPVRAALCIFGEFHPAAVA